MYLYIVTCQDGSYYTGIAKDIRVRLQAHYDRKKQCAKYTKSHPIGHKIRRQRRGAAAAPGKTAAGGLVVFAADLSADALVQCAPDSLDTVIGTQQIAVLVCQDDRAVLGGGNAVLRALTERQPVDGAPP